MAFSSKNHMTFFLHLGYLNTYHPFVNELIWFMNQTVVSPKVCFIEFIVLNNSPLMILDSNNEYKQYNFVFSSNAGLLITTEPNYPSCEPDSIVTNFQIAYIYIFSLLGV